MLFSESLGLPLGGAAFRQAFDEVAGRRRRASQCAATLPRAVCVPATAYLKRSPKYRVRSMASVPGTVISAG